MQARRPRARPEATPCPWAAAPPAAGFASGPAPLRKEILGRFAPAERGAAGATGRVRAGRRGRACLAAAFEPVPAPPGAWQQNCYGFYGAFSLYAF